MGVGEGDFHRTRLTHSLECAQIGSGLLDQLCRSKRLPADLRTWFTPKALVEAACFSHDLGHPPFGHGGERALFAQMRAKGGFEANAHTLRILTRLEKHRRRSLGINATRRMVLAVLKYPRVYSEFDLNNTAFKASPPKCYFDDEADIVKWSFAGFTEYERRMLAQCDSKHKPANRTFDCSVMELADDIAYGIHDIEDIVARGLATQAQVAEGFRDAFEAVGGTLDTPAGPLDSAAITISLFKDSYTRKEMIGRLVNTFMTGVLVREQRDFSHPLLRFRADLPDPQRQLLSRIREMSHKLVIDRPGIQQLEYRGQRVVAKLFSALLTDPARLIDKFSNAEDISAATKEREVCDYVAGMTDSYAERVYRRLFVPGFGSSHDEL